VSSTTARPVQGNVWFLAIRPKTLPAAVTPVIVGTAVAVAASLFHLPSALSAFTVALLLQIAANLANDVFDFRRGADTEERLGPLRVTQSGLIQPQQVLVATALTLALAMLVGLYLVTRGGWPILLAGLAAILSALAYTGGPRPIGYHGLGEVFVFIFFGLVAVGGTFYVQAGDMSALALGAAVPVGCLATAILVVNNLRDIETDRAAGKRTVAVRIGREWTVLEYALLLVIAYLTPPLLWLTGAIGVWGLLPLLTLPLAVRQALAVSRTTGRALNPLLGGTARLQLLFGICFAAGIILS
jgi:1,4-dihydroxy-2-naphthoate polyprenyltransferase